MLPLFGEAHTMVSFWRRMIKRKLKYLVAAMAASRTFEKSTYATWLRFFYEGDGSRSGYVVDAFLAY